MIHKVEYVMLSCDNCKKDFIEYHNGFSIFVDENQAYEEASNDDWFRNFSLNLPIPLPKRKPLSIRNICAQISGTALLIGVPDGLS